MAYVSISPRPASHRHASGAVAPSAGSEIAPHPQDVQGWSPPRPKVPRPHGSQGTETGDPVAVLCPGTQLQLAAFALPAGEALPRGQGVHAAEPLVALNVAGAHAAQAFPGGPV
jgi:hypothetical protein